MGQRVLVVDEILCDPEEVQLWIAAFAKCAAAGPKTRGEEADDAVREYRKRCRPADDEAP